MKTLFIVNPKSGGGKPARRWPEIREIFRAEDWTFEVAFTESRGHATLLTRSALKDGF